MKQVLEPRLLTIPCAAHYAGVSATTIEGYIASGQLHTFRLPAIKDEDSFLKRTLIERAELDKLIDRGMRL